MFKNSVPTSERTRHYTITKINYVTLFKQIIAVYGDNHKYQTVLLTVTALGTYNYRFALKG
jgi:hypothetical protein